MVPLERITESDQKEDFSSYAHLWILSHIELMIYSTTGELKVKSFLKASPKTSSKGIRRMREGEAGGAVFQTCHKMAAEWHQSLVLEDSRRLPGCLQSPSPFRTGKGWEVPAHHYPELWRCSWAKSQIPDPQRLWNNVHCCVMLPHFEVICYLAVRY